MNVIEYYTYHKCPNCKGSALAFGNSYECECGDEDDALPPVSHLVTDKVRVVWTSEQ